MNDKDHIRSVVTRFFVMWRVMNGPNRFSAISFKEAKRYGTEGQVFYLPADPDPNRVMLKRLGKNDLRLDSDLDQEHGYTFEGPLGFPWRGNSGPPGTQQDRDKILRYSNGPNYATMSLLNALPAEYKPEKDLNLRAYPRYLNSNEQLLELKNREISIKSNEVAGGQVWSWTWNNKQFLNTWDYGRGMQSAMGIPIKQSEDPARPTEGGAGSPLSGDFLWGSPIIVCHNEGQDGLDEEKTQVTRCSPSEFTSTIWDQSNDVKAVFSGFELGKQLILNDNTLKDKLPDNFRAKVATYVTEFRTPIKLTEASIEIPTCYLETDFNTFYTYEAPSNELTKKDIPGYNGIPGNLDHLFRFETTGGPIFCTSDKKYAMGIYGGHKSDGGHVRFFSIHNLGATGTVKMAAESDYLNLDPGIHLFRTWIVTGSLDDVREIMRTLYNAGVR